MAKLRAIKERRNEDPGFEQDLRGLGGTDLLANEFPWVFLSVKGQPKQLEQVCSLLGLQHKTGLSKDQIHLFKPGQHENHKEKTLQLFGAAALLAHHNSHLPMLIGQLSILAERIKGTDPKDIREESSEDFQSWKGSPGLSTPEHIRLYLSHAGIHLTQELVTHEHLKSVIEQHSAGEAKVTHLGRKVG